MWRVDQPGGRKRGFGAITSVLPLNFNYEAAGWATSRLRELPRAKTIALRREAGQPATSKCTKRARIMSF